MATIYTRRAIIVVGAQWMPDPNNIAKNIDVGGGERTFQYARLSASGSLPVSHYWCSWAMTEAEYAQLRNLCNNYINQGRIFWYDGALYTPQQVLVERGLKMIPWPV